MERGRDPAIDPGGDTRRHPGLQRPGSDHLGGAALPVPGRGGGSPSMADHTLRNTDWLILPAMTAAMIANGL